MTLDESTAQLSDPKDDFLLSLYDKGKATVIVSGDKNFLSEASEMNYCVMTLREFEQSCKIPTNASLPLKGRAGERSFKSP